MDLNAARALIGKMSDTHGQRSQQAALIVDVHIDAQAERLAKLTAALTALAEEFDHSSDLWHNVAGHPYDRKQAAEGAAKFPVYDEAAKKIRAALGS